MDENIRRGKEGSRWYNARPASDEVASWFATIPLHEGMDHEHYIGGVTLILAKERSEEVAGFDDQGLPIIKERQDLVYVPYVKVETRVAYFWKLMDIRAWRGKIEPVAPVGGDQIGQPPGYFRYSASKPDGKVVNFVGCSMQVSVRESSRTSSEGPLVMSPPPGAKIIPATTKWDVDVNALMKAETGAIGRALGVAGMLVVPGSGVATAEDMLELSAAAPAAVEPQLPDVPQPATPVTHAGDEQLRSRAAELVAQLAEQDPKGHEAFQEWARGRNLRLDSAQGAALRGVVKKLENTLGAVGA
jgi:hypothetical protein